MSQTRLIYVANNRLPSEKANGLQIAHMCEALAENGCAVTLVTPRRRPARALRKAPDIWTYYGVEPSFEFKRLPCLDLIERVAPRWQMAPFLLQTLTFLLSVWWWLLRRRADILYTRDEYAGALLAASRPRTRLIYEPHQVRQSWLGRRIQAWVARRAALVVPITAHLGATMRDLGATRVLVAHDGIRQARFDAVPDQEQARAKLGWPADAFVVGWVGRLTMLGLDKGVGLLVDALSRLDGVTLALVGGPDEMVAALRERWRAANQPDERFLAAGQVPPGEVPLYLSACDVCAMPHPWTEQFAYYTSPIKLFEYMAAGRAVVASDLPAFAEVLTHEDTALLVRPGDADALAQAIERLRVDSVLRASLGRRARDIAFSRYTWTKRAQSILSAVAAP